MPKYVFIYHQPEGYVPGTDGAATAAWQSFFEGMADSIADPGLPVSDRQTLGDVGAATQLGGYTVVEANDLDSATSLARGCPTLTRSGGVEIGELVDLPAEHIASQLRNRVGTA